MSAKSIAGSPATEGAYAPFSRSTFAAARIREGMMSPSTRTLRLGSRMTPACRQIMQAIPTKFATQ